MIALIFYYNISVLLALIFLHHRHVPKKALEIERMFCYNPRIGR